MNRDALIEWLNGRISLLIVIAALVVLLLMVAQISVEQQQPVEERFQNDLVVQDGPTRAQVDLTSGANKPMVSHRGVQAVEVSGWESDLTVNGDTRSLWRHRFGFSRNPESNTIVYTRSTSRYELAQHITVTRGTVLVEYYITPEPDTAIQTVTVDLAFYRDHFDAVAADDRDVRFQYSDGGDEYTGTLSVGDNGELIEVDRGAQGPKYFVVTHTISDPPPARRTLIARHEITLSGGSPDTPDAD